MVYLTDVAVLAAEAAPIALGTAYLLAHRRAVHRRRCVRYTDMLLVELGRMKEFVDVLSVEPSARLTTADDGKAYGGLISSGNLAWFDTDRQSALAEAYDLFGELVSRTERGTTTTDVDMSTMVELLQCVLHTTMADIESFRLNHTTSGRNRVILKALRLAYDD